MEALRLRLADSAPISSFNIQVAVALGRRGDSGGVNSPDSGRDNDWDDCEATAGTTTTKGVRHWGGNIGNRLHW